MQKRKLGASGLEVSALGLGCMGMTWAYGAPGDRSEMIALLRNAVELGITFFDTAEVYGPFTNEELVGEALEPLRDKVVIATKFGFALDPEGGKRPVGVNSQPTHIKVVCEAALKRLRTDRIDLFYQHRVDPSVPIEDTIGAIADLVRAGYVRHIGLSEVGAATVARAQSVHPIVDLQIEYSLAARGPEQNIFPALGRLGISATLYGIFSRGLLTGSKPQGRGDFRAYLPRFAPGNSGQNNAVVAGLQRFATDRGMSAGQLAIAWVLARQPAFVPLVGAKTRAQLADALGALDKPLSASDVAALEALAPEGAIAGTRYGAEQMAHLDSEK